MGDIDPIRWLADLEALRRMPQRYARAVDERDFDSLAELFDPGGEVDGTRGRQPVPEYVAGLRDLPPTFEHSTHLLADPLIDHEPGSDTAAMDTYAVVFQVGRIDGGADMTLGMRYQDELVRRDDRWVIRHRKATMRWLR